MLLRLSGMFITVITNAPRRQMISSGVMKEITLVSLSMSNRPDSKSKTTMIAEPTQVGKPNCCSMFEPAPATMTKPMQNKVNIVVMSM